MPNSEAVTGSTIAVANEDLVILGGDFVVGCLLFGYPPDFSPAARG